MLAKCVHDNNIQEIFSSENESKNPPFFGKSVLISTQEVNSLWSKLEKYCNFTHNKAHTISFLLFNLSALSMGILFRT